MRFLVGHLIFRGCRATRSSSKSSHVTQEDLAGILFDSLRSKIMTLADDVIVYPAHGAGSACGRI